jgi:hypothetical protein
MINIANISKTRAGLNVISVEYYPNNPDALKIRADIEEADGQVETDYFYSTGQFSYLQETHYDLVEEPLRDTYSKPMLCPRVDTEQATTGTTGAYTALLTSVIEDLYESIGILKVMQGDMDSLTK